MYAEKKKKKKSSLRKPVIAFLCVCFTLSGCKWTSAAFSINLHFSAQVQGASYLPMNNLFENKEL